MLRQAVIAIVCAAAALPAAPSSRAAEMDANGVPVPRPVTAKAPFHDTSLMQDLVGRWAGPGSAQYSDGTSEQLRCVATYIDQGARTLLRQTLRCSGPKLILKLEGNWTIRNGTITGTWAEETYSISGQLSGSAVPSGFDLKATSTWAEASVAVRMVGCAQDVEMTFSQDIDRMHLALKKC